MFASERHQTVLRIGPQQRQKLGPEGRPPKCLGISRKNHWWLRDVRSSVKFWIQVATQVFLDESSSLFFGED